MKFFPLQLLVKGECVQPRGYYPPMNYEYSCSKYFLRLAVSGYHIDSLRMYLDGNKLIVSSESNENEYIEYIYKGIAGRSFKYTFLVDGLARITGTNIINGVLSIEIEYNIPNDRIQIPLSTNCIAKL